ncbi:MAG: type II toxin-antitoxin system RelE/ParE family toxin [Trueperaceae bacterium]
MRRPVLLTDGAARDLDELYFAAHERHGAATANQILVHIRSGLDRIAATTDAGEPPPELRALGMRDAREVRSDGHRIVYRVRDGDAHVVLIATAVRSMQSLLQRRMLDA